MTDSSPITYVVISYFPLLTGTAGELIDPGDEEAISWIQEVIEKLPDGNAVCCLWTDGDEGPRPILVFKDADAIHDHLIAWSEDDPTGWFHLTLLQKDGKYLIGLSPNIKRSIDRFGIAHQLKTGFPVPQDAKFSVLFQSLYFVSGSTNMFDLIKDKLPDEFHIGLMDASLLNIEDPESMDADKIHWLGPFPKAPDRYMDEYFESVIDDAEEPTDRPVIFDGDGKSVSP
jgi:hypothetical protein